MGYFIIMKHGVQTRTKAVVLLSPAEREEFFPDPLARELDTLLEGPEWIRAPLAGQTDWRDLLRQKGPEIIVGAWETPALPVELCDEPDAMPKYLCFLCGSVRGHVPRKLIEQGLLVSNWGGVISDTVAECALLLILSCMRRSSHWTLAMHTQGAWKEGRHPDTQSLFGRRVGLHGLGAIGRELVSLLKPFNVPVAAFSPSVPDAVFRDLGVDRVDSLDQLFSTSDVLVELAPAKPENRHLVDERVLRLLPEGATFVNVGRGMVVDEEALARMAREGRLQIGLDVYEQEPLPADSPLRELPNVNLLPHLGGPTRDRRKECGKLALRNLRHYLNGEPLENLVTLDVYDRAT